MAILAEAFGWSERFILFELPLSRGEQYYHVLLRKSRWRTYAPAESSASQLARIDTVAPPWAMPAEDIEAAWQRFEAIQ